MGSPIRIPRIMVLLAWGVGLSSLPSREDPVTEERGNKVVGLRMECRPLIPHAASHPAEIPKII